MKKNFICTNFSQCSSADNGEIFEIEDYLATKCPTCKNTTLEEYVPPRGFCTRFKKVCMFGGGGLSLVMASYLIFGGGTPSESIVDKPIQEKPIQEKPIQEKPIQEKPIQEKPIQEKPIQEKPIQEKPIQEKPIQEKPIQEKPIQEKPIQEKPIQEKPIQEEPVKVVVPKPKPTCAKNQHIVNNKCVDNKPTCTKNQHIVNNKCVNNQPTCTKNQHLSNNRCVDNIVPPQLYTLRITTTPSDAHISGVTNGAKLKKGSYTITVSKRGYESKTVTINLNSNKHINVSLTKIDIPEPIPRTPVVTPNHPSCAGGISKIRSLISSGQRMEASSLKSRLMASDDCSESEQSVIDDIKP